MVTAFLSGIDNADLWLAIPFLLGLAIALLLTFGVDMCRQNVKSIKALPILAMLFVIGAVMVAFSIVLVVVVVGIWLALRTHVKSEELKDRNNDSLKCNNCIHYGNCPSVGVPCSRHQNWR
jgi:ABC-type microcin C transport system permease subunit YejE